MALSSDQKKHLLIGGGLGALALFMGQVLFGGRRGHAGALPGGHGHEGHRKHHHEEGDRAENERGEYGKKKHKHHHGGNGRG